MNKFWMGKNLNLISIVLFTSILLLTWLHTESSARTTHAPNPVNQNAPDWFATNITTLTMDELGKPLRQIYAEKMFHYTEDSTTDLTLPHLMIYQENNAPWEVTAHTGRLNHGATLDDISHLDLWDDVKLWRVANATHPNQQMTTSELTYYPDDDFAHTDAPVTIEQPGQVTHGVGMNIYLENQQLEFLSTVKGQHDATPLTDTAS